MCLKQWSLYCCSNLTCYMSSQQHSTAMLEFSEGCFGCSQLQIYGDSVEVSENENKPSSTSTIPKGSTAQSVSTQALWGRFAPPETLRNPAHDPRPLTSTQVCLLKSELLLRLLQKTFSYLVADSILNELLHLCGNKCEVCFNLLEKRPTPRPTKKINTTRCCQKEGKQKTLVFMWLCGYHTLTPLWATNVGLMLRKRSATSSSASNVFDVGARRPSSQAEKKNQTDLWPSAE